MFHTQYVPIFDVLIFKNSIILIIYQIQIIRILSYTKVIMVHLDLIDSEFWLISYES